MIRKVMTIMLNLLSSIRMSLTSSRRIDLQKLNVMAEKALDKGDLDKAQKYYERIIKLLE